MVMALGWMVACVVAGGEAAEMKVAGPLAFGPDGVLFVGDPLAAAVFAVETEDTGDAAEGAFSMDGVGQEMADLLGVESSDLLLNDMAVNPASGNVYLSASRGRGPDAVPVLFWIDRAGGGELDELFLDDYEVTSAALPNPPAEQVARGRRNQRANTITDLLYLDGRLYIAGLSNEEFASKLRSIPYPFEEVDAGASVEIYHGAHGAYETRAPVRTFAGYVIEDEPHLLAAYTCTPLVKFPIVQLEPGDKVRGVTVAELGSGNRPLDMIVYRSGDEDYALIANSARGMMKIPLAAVDEVTGITERVAGTAGLTYETIDGLDGVVQMDRLGPAHALILREKDDGTFSLETIDLP